MKRFLAVFICTLLIFNLSVDLINAAITPRDKDDIINSNDVLAKFYNASGGVESTVYYNVDKKRLYVGKTTNSLYVLSDDDDVNKYFSNSSTTSESDRYLRGTTIEVNLPGLSQIINTADPNDTTMIELVYNLLLGKKGSPDSRGSIMNATRTEDGRLNPTEVVVSYNQHTGLELILTCTPNPLTGDETRSFKFNNHRREGSEQTVSTADMVKWFSTDKRKQSGLGGIFDIAPDIFDVAKKMKNLNLSSLSGIDLSDSSLEDTLSAIEFELKSNPPKSSYNHWLMSIKRYITEDRIDSGLYDINDLPKNAQGSIIKTEEAAFLQSMLKTLSDAGTLHQNKSDYTELMNGLPLDSLRLDRNFLGHASSDPNLSMSLDKVNAIRIANDVAGKYSTSVSPSVNNVSVSIYAGDIIKYLYPKMMGVPYESLPQDVDSLINEDAVVFSEMLSTLAIDPEFMFNYPEIGLYAGGYPGVPSALRWVLANEEAWKAYNQITLIYFIMAAYANDETTSGITMTEGSSRNATDVLNSSNYSNENLDRLIADNQGKEKDAILTSAIQSQIAAYRGIYEALQYLGVSAWTPHLKRIVEYYPHIEPFFENTQLSEYFINEAEPLRDIFSIASQQFSTYYNMGFALSSSYVPLKTNLYEPNSLRMVEDVDFINEFHYRFGFYRKALYIDTNASAAVDRYVSGTRGTLRPAKLKDLLNPSKDIVLYIDTKFYNIDEVAKAKNFEYENIRNTEDGTDEAGALIDSGKEKIDNAKEFVDDTSRVLSGDVSVIAGNALENAKDSIVEGVNGSNIVRYFETDINSIAKTGGKQLYEERLYDRVSAYGKLEFKSIFHNRSILSDSNIDNYLLDTDYSPMQSYAVVSAIYRDRTLYPIAQEYAAQPKPVFVSSPNLYKIVGIPHKEFNTIFNHMMIVNLHNNKGIDYKTTIDEDSLVYMDIYGNILSESGLVIIPAASNATLISPQHYTPYTVGFLDLYNNGEKIPYTDNQTQTERLSEWMRPDLVSNEWCMVPRYVNGTIIDFSNVPKADIEFLTVIRDGIQVGINKGSLMFQERVGMILEVLRGATQDQIDKFKEGLDGGRTPGKYGVFAAYKLDTLVDGIIRLGDNNILLNLPNLAYTKGIEYVIILIYKIMFCLLTILLLWKVYKDAMKGRLGVLTIGRFLLIFVAFAMVLVGIPRLIEASYYSTNKHLLKKETELLSLLNLEKESEGREIGIYDITEPKSDTKLYLKIKDVDFPWYRAIGRILNSDALATMNEIYADQFANEPMYLLPGVERRANGIYMPLDYLYNSSSIEFNSSQRFIYHRLNDTPTASFVLPYYFILDSLVRNVNTHNMENNILDYTTRIQDTGSVKVVGTIGHYLTSTDFMEDGHDLMGFRFIYGAYDTYVGEDSGEFTIESIEAMKDSQWFYGSNLSDETIYSGLNQLDDLARQFVRENRFLLDRVTDESFLKVMALSLALSHNDVFNVPGPSNIEIFELDPADLLRLLIADKETAMKFSTLSFGRYVYESSGLFGVLVVAGLLVVYFVSSIVKPLVLSILVVLFVISVIWKRLIVNSKEESILGYVVTAGLIAVTGILHALIIKLSMLIASLGWPAIFNILLQIVVQVTYLWFLCLICKLVITDFNNYGYQAYSMKFSEVRHNMIHRYEDIRSRFSSGSRYQPAPTVQGELTVPGVRFEPYESRRSDPNKKARDILDSMHERDRDTEQ